MKQLNIGCGTDIMEDADNLDIKELPGVSTVYDLEQCNTSVMPFNEDTYDEIYASHILEHIQNILPLMEELHRVAKPGGKLLVRVPYGSSDAAFGDPTHTRFFFPESFHYFGQPAYARADYGYRGDWKVTELILLVSEPVFDMLTKMGVNPQFAVKHFHNIVVEMICTMEAVKPIRPVDKTLHEPTEIQIQVLPREATQG